MKFFVKSFFATLLITLFVSCATLSNDNANPKFNKKYCQVCGNDAIVWLDSENAYVCADCFTVHETKTLKNYYGSYTGSFSIGTDEESYGIYLELNGPSVNVSYNLSSAEPKQASGYLSEEKNKLVCKLPSINLVIDFISFEDARIVCDFTIDNHTYEKIFLSNAKWKYSQFGSTVKNVETTKNASFDIPEFKIEKTEYENVYKIVANPKRGYWFDALLWVPDSPEGAEINNLYVRSYLPSSCISSDLTYDNAIRELATCYNEPGNVKDKLQVPILMFLFPRIFYNWSADFPEIGSTDLSLMELKQMTLMQKGILKRIDNQMAALICDSLDYLNENYAQMAPKVLMSGYSATGSFAANFPILHPELVQASVCGAAWPILPVKSYQGQDLLYQIGISNFEYYTGEEFNLEEWKKVHMLYTRGAYDLYANDPLWDPSLMFKDLNEIFDVNSLPEAFPYLFALLNETSNHVETIYYVNRSHEENFFDTMDFLKENCKDEMNFLVSSEDIKIVYSLDNSEIVKEKSVCFESEKSFGTYGPFELRLPYDDRCKVKIVLQHKVDDDTQGASVTLNCENLILSKDKIMLNLFDNRNVCNVILKFNINEITSGKINCSVVVNNVDYGNVCFVSQNDTELLEMALTRLAEISQEFNSQPTQSISEDSLEKSINELDAYLCICDKCGASSFTYKRHKDSSWEYVCSNCGTYKFHETIEPMLQGIWHGTVGDKDFTLYYGAYDGGRKILFDGEKNWSNTSSGNWYHEDPQYAGEEEVEFNNNGILFSTISADSLITELFWNDKHYTDIVFYRE